MSNHVSIQKASNGFVVTDYDDRCDDLPTIQIADNFATACSHAAECLGATYTVGGHGDDGAKELQRLTDSLRDTIQKNNFGVADLKIASAIGGVSEATFAACIRMLPDNVLTKWPSLGKGGLAKMRDYVDKKYSVADEAPVADEAEDERKKPVTPERHGMDSVRQTEGSGPL